MPNKYFSVDGLATYVHHTGPTSLPEVPPALDRGELLLCLHGAGNNGNLFRGLFEKLADRHSPIAFDQPAHSRSGGIDSLGSIERMADFTSAFARKLDLRSPRVLVGHSMGGAVALQTALDSPDEVRALVICSTPLAFLVPEFLLEPLRRVTEGKARRQFERGAYSPATPDEIVHRGFMEDARTDPRVMYGDLVACGDWRGGERVGSLEVPTLVIYGEDEIAPLAEGSRQLAEAIPGARLEEIPKAGHMVPTEQTEVMADLIESFLSELPS